MPKYREKNKEVNAFWYEHTVNSAEELNKWLKSIFGFGHLDERIATYNFTVTKDGTELIAHIEFFHISIKLIRPAWIVVDEYKDVKVMNEKQFRIEYERA